MNENACVGLGEKLILWAEKDAWRYFRWMLPPSADLIYPAPVPGDYFEKFPLGLNE